MGFLTDLQAQFPELGNDLSGLSAGMREAYTTARTAPLTINGQNYHNIAQFANNGADFESSMKIELDRLRSLSFEPVQDPATGGWGIADSQYKEAYPDRNDNGWWDNLFTYGPIFMGAGVGALAAGVGAAAGTYSTIGAEGAAGVGAAGTGAAGTGAAGLSAGSSPAALPSFGFVGSDLGAGYVASGLGTQAPWYAGLEQLFTGAGGKGSALSTLGNIFSAGSGFYNASQLRDAGRDAAAANDPFASQRPAYQKQLADLMANPSSITKTPGYDAGLQAVERRGAAQGWNGSTNMMESLAAYGGNFYKDEIARLMQLSGANISPSGGSALLAGEQAASNQEANAWARLGLLFPRNG